MKSVKVLGLLTALLGVLWVSPVFAGPAPVVILETSMGRITLMLDERTAPKAVENFLRYVDAGFYRGTIFHRVIDSADMSMIQGGGFDSFMKRLKTDPPIVNESISTKANTAGTIAMARTNDPDSATSQFFINAKDNDAFNYKSAKQPGYAVFGKVIRGMDVVKKIVAVKTGSHGLFKDVPKEPVFIKKAYRMHK